MGRGIMLAHSGEVSSAVIEINLKEDEHGYDCVGGYRCGGAGHFCKCVRPRW